MNPIHKEAQVRLGDTVVRTPVTLGEPDHTGKKCPPMRGKVVWVHPKGRFHVVDFGEGRTTVRESFQGVER